MRFRRGAKLSSISAREMNRLREQQKEPLGLSGLPKSMSSDVVALVGRNDCGYQLVPGSPVVLGVHTAEQTEFGNWRAGWVSLRPCYLPRSVSESVALLGDLFSTAIVVDLIEPDDCGKVILSGVVEVRCNPGMGWVAPKTLANSDYRSQLQPHPTWGVARKIVDLGNNRALVQLGHTSNWVPYTLQQAMQIPPAGTLAELSGFGDAYVMDVYDNSRWQANGDRGVARLINNRWYPVGPWCIGDTPPGNDPEVETPPPPPPGP